MKQLFSFFVSLIYSYLIVFSGLADEKFFYLASTDPSLFLSGIGLFTNFDYDIFLLWY